VPVFGFINRKGIVFIWTFLERYVDYLGRKNIVKPLKAFLL